PLRRTSLLVSPRTVPRTLPWTLCGRGRSFASDLGGRRFEAPFFDALRTEPRLAIDGEKGRATPRALNAKLHSTHFVVTPRRLDRRSVGRLFDHRFDDRAILGLERPLQPPVHRLIPVRADDGAARAREFRRGPDFAGEFDHPDVFRVKIVDAAA